jgi:hypothetical protein
MRGSMPVTGCLHPQQVGCGGGLASTPRWQHCAAAAACNARGSSAAHSVNTSPLGPFTWVSGRSTVIVVALTCPARARAAASWCLLEDGI